MVGVRTIAVAVIVVGALAFAFPTLATEQFNTERPTGFSIASEDNALIGAEGTGNTVRNPGRGNPTAVGTLTNNLDSNLPLAYRVYTTDGAIEPDPKRKTVSLVPGGSADITVRCTAPGQQGGGGSGTAVVTVTVESAQADGIGVENADFDFQVQYDCASGNGNGGGPPGEEEDDEEEDEEEEEDED